jgi:hypothetical protein
MSKLTQEEINNAFGIFIQYEFQEPHHFRREFREFGEELGWSSFKLNAEYSSFKKRMGVL